MRRPVVALVAWFIVLAAVIGLGASVGGKLNDSFSLPDTESTTAQDLLAQAYGGTGSLEAGATIVWSPATGTAVDPAVIARVQPMLQEIADLKSVACVTTLTGASLGSDCPTTAAGPTPQELAKLTAEQKAAFAAYAAAAAPISKDKTVAYSSITFTGDGTQVSTADAKTILGLVKTNNADGLTVAASGQALEFAGQEPPSSELYGVGAAIIILLIAFGSLVAAGLPIVAAIIGLAMGQMGVLLVANFLDVATFAPTLAAMIGLGVGI
ncbi:MAG: MMPL family transporter, partial [Candidatus Nanopelagicales bacterium]